MSDDIEIETGGSEDDETESIPELPAPDFDFLVYSLRLQAEMNLGLLPFGAAGEDEPAADFDLARHNIELLAMLHEKTRGNLTADEQRALDNSLAELRVRFAEAQQQESE